jgi:hypothetical protein
VSGNYASWDAVRSDSNVTHLNGSGASHAVVQFTAHSQVASPGTRAVKVHNVDMAMCNQYIISPYTLGSVWSPGLCWPLRRPYTPLAT